jgi:8-oxo-dGTP pyrophosphatase MutT (NUDIX family)
MEKTHASGYFVYKLVGGEVRFLLIRSERDGYWGFPKGHVDAGEDLRAAAERELAEETGITDFTPADGFKAVVSYPVRGKPKQVTYFLAQVPPDTCVSLSKEHTAYKWLSPENVIKILAFPNLKEAFRRAAEYVGRIDYDQLPQVQ